MAALYPLIILLPLIGSAIIGLTGFLVPNFRQREGLIGTIATAAIAIPFLLVVAAFMSFDGTPIRIELFTWMQAGKLDISFYYHLDQLSLLMGMIVTGIGSLIHIYSIGYMHGDEGYYKFFAYLNLFIFAMNNLILGDNMAVMFLGWEGVGLCSYLLIGFWFQDMKKAQAAQKAFIANRIGDFAMLVAMFLVFTEFGSLNFSDLNAGVTEALNNGTVASLYGNKVWWIALLVFIAATGKSAQIPLFVWLPDAMAGPTPVSALIHAATMVTSGIYLIARIHPVYLATPEIMTVVVIVAAATALMAAFIAIAQNDIKGVLAYSTVSQLGFMFMALGAGAFTTAIFHVMTHAFFKACLFLGSGSVIHAMEHMHTVKDPQDIRTMGGLGKHMPSTSRTFWISTLAIAGIPGLAGFFSKDEILASLFFNGFERPMYFLIWGIGLFTAVLT
ncbi:MAG: NADH-quinone oxidoreductase subunit L, partial [Bacteroidota bacterium]